MSTLAYLRVSKHIQDMTHQRLAILEFARRERLTVEDFLELSVSSRRSPKERKVDMLLTQLAPGGTLIVSELSRLGRSVGGHHHRRRHSEATGPRGTTTWVICIPGGCIHCSRCWVACLARMGPSLARGAGSFIRIMAVGLVLFGLRLVTQALQP